MPCSPPRGPGSAPGLRVKDATPLIDAKLRDNPARYPSKEVMNTLSPLETLPLRVERVRTRGWTGIKTGT